MSGQALLATIIQLMVSPKKYKCKQVNPVKSPCQTVKSSPLCQVDTEIAAPAQVSMMLGASGH